MVGLYLPDVDEDSEDLEYQLTVLSVERQVRQLHQSGVIREAMDINRFLNHAEEDEQISLNDLEDVLREFLQGKEAESDEEVATETR